MKRLLLTLGLAGVATQFAFGQGAIVFTTRGGGVDAPVTNIVTGQRVGAGYLAQLYYGATAGDITHTFPEAPAGFSTTLPGYILSSSGGGTRFVDTAVVAAGANTWFEVRAWETALGATWDAAWLAYNDAANALYGKAVLGKSVPIQTITSATALDAPKNLTGLAGFNIVPVPEPSVIALGAIGLLALLWRRRN